MSAARKGAIKVVKWLCEVKADVDCKERVRVIRGFEVFDVKYATYVCCDWFD